ncbi:MAG TPA: alpha/beta fold hydrolase [Xanthobacteraceae bacterium]|nr:alpha/beta fold hydrolase [Xanthobacteraceae bacterium]
MSDATKKRRLTKLVIAMPILAALGVGMAGPSGHGQGSAEKLAIDVVNDVVNHRLAAVVARFTPDVAQGLSLPALEKMWEGVLLQGGAVREIAPARVDRVIAGGTVVIVPVWLEHAMLELKISVANDKVAGFFITQPWSAPDYVDRAKFTDLAVTVGPMALGGTLSLPEMTAKETADRVPAVVLIHGSGPHDRDATIGPNRPFRDIAEGLASRGIAALRYEKRTKAHPERFAGTFTVWEESIEDVIAAVALLAGRQEIDAKKIVIVGHSLGGMLAPRIAAGRNDIAGVIIMAGPTRPIPLIMVVQAEYLANLDGPADETIKKVVEETKAEATRAMMAKPGNVGPNILRAPARYWADLNAYDPAATAAKLSLPLLILQGERDYQVTADDLKRFKTALAGRRNVTIREFPPLNHLFMPGEGKIRPEEYLKPGHVDPSVIETLVGFMSSLPK